MVVIGQFYSIQEDIEQHNILQLHIINGACKMEILRDNLTLFANSDNLFDNLLILFQLFLQSYDTLAQLSEWTAKCNESLIRWVRNNGAGIVLLGLLVLA